MSDNGAVALLGKINAINTLIENFPSSLLDLLHGPRYDNVVDFLIDVLEACGVDIHDVILELFSDIFDMNNQVVSGITGMYESIENIEIDKNSKFFNSLEYSVKGVLMALLSSIFSCSALPILPNKYFDVGKNDPKFTQDMRNAIEAFQKLTFPIEVIDPFGYLGTNPLSKEGRLFYDIEGKDVCYQKVSAVTTETYDSTEQIPHCLHKALLCLKFGNKHAQYVTETEYGSEEDNHEIEDELYFHVDTKLSEDLTIDLKYATKDNLWDFKHLTIKSGEQDSETFNLTPAFGRTPLDPTTGQRESYGNVTLKCGEASGEYAVCVGNTHVMLSRTLSQPVIDFWLSRNNATLSFGLKKDTDIINDSNLYNCPNIDHTDTIVISSVTYTYEKCEFRDDAVFYNEIPENVTSADDDFIMVHEGLVSSTLNRTYDMNAFLWYTMHKTPSNLQFEINKTMWDSRINARKSEVERVSPEEWNEWYNSKTTKYEELSCPSLNDTSNKLFPILQCQRHELFPNELIVEFPAQKFFKPKAKDTDSDFTYKTLRLNSTLYEYNWRYLNNIQIFKPKIILYGMLDALLGGIISLKNSLSFNFKREEMKAKLSEAIKKYIEAVDTEVEDCYFEFSNDEFELMLEDMLLSRYNSILQQSQTPTVKDVSIEEYLVNIDKVNFDASQEGSISQIMKTVTDVSLKSPGEFQSVDYGIELGYDKNWWKQVVMALAMPIIESIFTPQVILLIMINFEIMGIVNTEALFTDKSNGIVNLIINKIFALIKSIIRLIMDKVKEILLRMVFKYLLPKLTTYELLLLMERIDAWIQLLKEVATCVPLFNFSIRKSLGRIDNVQYADIVEQQSLPESDTNC